MSATASEIKALREALSHCSPETIDAAVRYRSTGDMTAVPTIVLGILERYLPKKNAQLLATATPATRLTEDLGIDSMSLLEVALTAEEVFAIRVENEELRDIRTLGDLEAFVRRKLGGDGP